MVLIIALSAKLFAGIGGLPRYYAKIFNTVAIATDTAKDAGSIYTWWVKDRETGEEYWVRLDSSIQDKDLVANLKSAIATQDATNAKKSIQFD